MHLARFVIAMSLLPGFLPAQMVTLQGTLVVIYNDPPGHGLGVEYALQAGSQYLEVIFPDPSVVRGVHSQSQVEVTGTLAGSRLFVARTIQPRSETPNARHLPFRVLSAAAPPAAQVGQRSWH
jgi:hypothetical protein